MFAVYRDFSAAAEQDAIAGGAPVFGVTSRNKRLQEVKLLTVCILRCVGRCNLGPLQGKVRRDVASVKVRFELLRSIEAINWLPGSHKWAHNLRFKCEAILARTWRKLEDS